MGAEAPVQRALKAPADAGQLPFKSDPHIHGLGEDPQLEAVLQGLGEQLFKGDVQVHGKAHAAHRVHHADAPGGHIVHRRLHVVHQVHQGQGAGDIVGELEEGLLVHLARVRVVAAQVLHLAAHALKQGRIHDAGVAVILDHHHLPVGTYGVQLLPADEAVLPHRVG